MSSLSRRHLIRGIAGLGVAAAAWPVAAGCGRSAPFAREQPPGRVFRVGWLAEGPPLSESTPLTWPTPLGPNVQRFVDRLTELGYVEGRTLHWEFRRATTPEQLAAYAAELVALDVDLIVVLAAAGALRAVFQTPGATPVVMGACTYDPVGDGYAQSLARPGGKVTGVTTGPLPAEVLAKRLEVFKDTLPALTRLGFLLDAHEENLFTRDLLLSWLLPAARELGIEVVIEEVRELDELEGAFAALAHAGADGVMPVTRARWTGVDTAPRMIAAALRHRLPMSGFHRVWVAAGALVAYSVDVLALTSRTAEFVDQVLRGARPADFPIERPDTFELVINLNTARTLGLTIPPAVLARATEVIQ